MNSFHSHNIVKSGLKPHCRIFWIILVPTKQENVPIERSRKIDISMETIEILVGRLRSVALTLRWRAAVNSVILTMGAVKEEISLSWFMANNSNSRAFPHETKTGT